MIGETTIEFLSACCRLLDLLESPQDIPFLSGLIQREIIYRILRGSEGARLRAIATPRDQSHRTAKAIAWIRANYAKPLPIEDLAQISGMGVSTFQHHFRALTAMSPLQNFKNRCAFRQRVAACSSMGSTPPARPWRSATRARSQFNREYSRWFGRPTMRDVRSLRARPLDAVPTP